jgi:hypothetical protein
MSEPQVLGLLEHVHISDGELGALGGKGGSTIDIRNFGLMIQREHQALERDVREVAEGLRVTAQRPTKSPAVRDYIRKSVPILQKHLDKARSLQQTLVKAQPARASSSPTPQR